jgi:hypothetical protein
LYIIYFRPTLKFNSHQKFRRLLRLRLVQVTKLGFVQKFVHSQMPMSHGTRYFLQKKQQKEKRKGRRKKKRLTRPKTKNGKGDTKS